MAGCGPKPQRLDKALHRRGQEIAVAPKLIPVYAHRFLPSTALANGNPVLSVWQTDIIYYGTDLESYFQREFAKASAAERWVPRRIRFWSELIDAADLKAESGNPDQD